MRVGNRRVSPLVERLAWFKFAGVLLSGLLVFGMAGWGALAL